MGMPVGIDPITASSLTANVTPSDRILVTLRYLHGLERRAPTHLKRVFRKLQREILAEPPSALARMISRLPLRVLITGADDDYAARAFSAHRYTDFDLPVKESTVSIEMTKTHLPASRSPAQ